MALRVASDIKLTISQDNATTPQEPTFDSGKKSFADTTTYSESIGYTFNVPAGAVDTQISLGSLTEVDMLYLQAKGSGLLVSLVPVGKTLADVEDYELISNAPGVIPFKLAAIYVSNPGASAISLILGAAGN